MFHRYKWSGRVIEVRPDNNYVEDDKVQKEGISHWQKKNIYIKLYWYYLIHPKKSQLIPQTMIVNSCLLEMYSMYFSKKDPFFLIYMHTYILHRYHSIASGEI